MVGGEAIPAWGDQVDVIITRPCGTKWMSATQVVYIGGIGYFKVVAKDADMFTVTLENLGYPGNVNGVGNFPSLASIQPGGLQGPAGETEAGAFLIANNLNEGVAATMRTNLGLGTAAVRNTGVANGTVPLVDAGGGLISGDSVWATAAGEETKTASAARTALGLGTIATQDSNNVNITGGTITGVILGTAGIPRNYLLFQNIQATSVGGGSLTLGSWTLYPLNTEIWDTGNDATLAVGGAITLAQGTYRGRWRVPAYGVGLFQTRLRNVTTGAFIYGSSTKADSGLKNSSSSDGSARFTIVAATEVIQLEIQSDGTQLLNGLGVPCGFGNDEVYGALQLEKEIS